MVRYVVPMTQNDGFGSQFFSIISSICFASYFGYTYLYKPLSVIEHNYDNKSDFIQRIEKMMNIQGNFIDYNNFIENNPLLHLDILSFKDIHKHLTNCPDNIILRANYKGFFDLYAYTGLKGLDIVKELYYKNNTKPEYYKNKTNIAVHVRKVNLHDNRFSHVTDDTYVSFINYVLEKECLTNENTDIHIFSQTPLNNVFDYNFYQNNCKVFNTVFHIDENIESTFNGFVHADILITYNTCFSYTAGLLSNGKVYMHPFHHFKLPAWNLLPLHIEKPDLRHFLEYNGIPFDNDYIKLPSHIKKINLDIGLSYNAPHSQLWIEMDKKNELFCFGFDPVKENIASIKQGAKKRHPSHSDPLDPKCVGNKVFLINCALGLENGKDLDLYVTKNDVGCSSIYEPIHFSYDKSTCKMWRLDEFIKLLNVPYIHYIKLDTQGSDLNIIKSGRDLISEKVIVITMEDNQCEYKNTNNSTQDMDVYMTSIGFERIFSLDTHDPTYVNINYKHLLEECIVKQV